MLEVRQGGVVMNTAPMIEDTARIDRLTLFASDVFDLADRRADLDLRALVDDLFADLIRMNPEGKDNV